MTPLSNSKGIRLRVLSVLLGFSSEENVGDDHFHYLGWTEKSQGIDKLID